MRQNPQPTQRERVDIHRERDSGTYIESVCVTERGCVCVCETDRERVGRTESGTDNESRTDRESGTDKESGADKEVN